MYCAHVCYYVITSLLIAVYVFILDGTDFAELLISKGLAVRRVGSTSNGTYKTVAVSPDVPIVTPKVTSPPTPVQQTPTVQSPPTQSSSPTRKLNLPHGPPIFAPHIPTAQKCLYPGKVITVSIK